MCWPLQPQEFRSSLNELIAITHSFYAAILRFWSRLRAASLVSARACIISCAVSHFVILETAKIYRVFLRFALLLPLNLCLRAVFLSHLSCWYSRVSPKVP